MRCKVVSNVVDVVHLVDVIRLDSLCKALADPFLTFGFAIIFRLIYHPCTGQVMYMRRPWNLGENDFQCAM